MANGAKIFWQQCQHSSVTAINLCLWFIVEGTLVLVMLLCKSQMALSTSTDQSDAVFRCMLYLFENCLRLEFILCNLSMVSHSRFRENLKECMMKTASNERGFLFQAVKCLAVVLQKQALLNSSLYMPGCGQSSGKHPSTVVTTTPSLPALILFGPPKTTWRAMVYAA